MGKLIPSIPVWKQYLSYITEIRLDSYENELNGQLDLYLNKGRLMLCADNAIYSYDDFYYNFAGAIDDLEPDLFNRINEVLVLGMGLGSIPLLLEQKANRGFNLDLVELDADIIQLFNKYTLPRLSSSCQIIQSDAEVFIESNMMRYDLICVDLFLDHLIPDQFYADQFLECCKIALKPRGIIIYNAPGDNVDEIAASTKFAESVFKRVFPNSYCKHIYKNLMLFGFN